jgi:hypothetical protein
LAFFLSFFSFERFQEHFREHPISRVLSDKGSRRGSREGGKAMEQQQKMVKVSVEVRSDTLQGR